MDVRWALPVATTIVGSFLVDSPFPHPPCSSWAGCQLCALLTLLSASDGGFLFFLHLSGVGQMLGLSVLFSTPGPHMYIFCPLSWQQGNAVFTPSWYLSHSFSEDIVYTWKIRQMLVILTPLHVIETHSEAAFMLEICGYLNISY